MSELSSTIRIDDNFSEPLKNLTKAALDADGAVSALGKSIVDLADAEYLQETASNTLKLTMGKALTQTYNLAVKTGAVAIQHAINVGKSVKKMAIDYSSHFSDYSKQAAQKINLMKNEIGVIAERTKMFKNNIPFEINEAKISIYETKNKLAHKLDAYKRMSIARARMFKDNIPFEIKEAQIGIYETKIHLAHKLNAYKRTATEYRKTALERTKMFKNNIPFEIKEAQVEIYETKRRLANKLNAYKQSMVERAKVFKNNIQFDIKEAQVGIYETKVHLAHRINAYKKLANERVNAFKNGAFSLLEKGKGGASEMLTGMETFNYREALKEFAGAAKEFGKQLAVNTGGGIKKGVSWLKNSEAGKIVTGFAKDFAKIFSLHILVSLTGKVLDKFKEGLKNAGHSMIESINNSLDEINLSDKFKAMYGDTGKSAQRYAYDLANELGESATMVGEMSAKAAYQGIGTDDFERIMRLADKVGKLSLGETTESAANTLISNVKSGHDASSIAQMFGGGETMERQLKRAGYERALNRGDLNEALRIAEQIAEQAGLTDDKYQKASNSMSQNYKKIMNVVDNIKRRLGEIYNQQLAPVVERIAKFVQSEGFQVAVGLVERGIEKIGEAVNWLVNGLLDNIKIIGALLAVGAIARMWIMIRQVKNVISLVGFVKKGVIGVLKFLHLQNAALKVSQMTAKSLGKALLRAVAIPLLIAGAVAAAAYGIYKFIGTTKSFTGWIKGVLAAGIRWLWNAGTNVVTWFKNLPSNIQIVGLKIKQGVIKLVGFIKSQVGELLSWMVTKIFEFVKNSPLNFILDKMGVDVNGVANDAKEWANSFGIDESSEVKEIEKKIEELRNNQESYIDVMEGVLEEYESEGAWLKGKIDDIKKELTGANEKQGKIASDTDKLRKMNEQEEELAWLKAFSNRQIMSSYNSMTSNTRNVTINGMSQSGLVEMGRRNLSTIPSRATL